ncbi:PPE domain-containing protein [Mycobacteroides abscessus]|uniref:PPE domain-containing protein n=1 Tax=Mycobacteroides abscessus TaxID=36809 RepID=UPI0009A56C9C|nr:PPE domain-containing protein [Mycobacteroides abscessus]
MGYIPEINAGRFTGAGAETWIACAEVGVAFAGLVAQAMASMIEQAAELGLNWQGLAPTALEARLAAFFGWLAEMEAIALLNAAACLAVAEAYALGDTSMAPLIEVNQNRIDELIAEMTNFFGINSGLIAFLNGDYARMHIQNGGVMVTYDTAVTTATIPKPSTPPPPLASAAASAAGVAESTARATAGEATGAATQSMTQGLEKSVEGLSSGPQSGATNALSQFSQVGSQAGQAASGMLKPDGLTKPLESLAGPLQQIFGQLGGQTSDTGALFAGPDSGAFSGINAAAVSSGGGAGGYSGGGGGLGGGLGGSLTGGAYPSSGGPVKSQNVFNGVSTKPTGITTSGASGVAGGGGYMPHGGGGGDRSTRASGSRSKILAVASRDDGR